MSTIQPRLPLGVSRDNEHSAARAPGPLGIYDQGDTDNLSFVGATPGPVGINDVAMLLTAFQTSAELPLD